MVTLADLAAAIMTVLILLVSFITRPKRARCPDTYDLRTGIQASGRFNCWPHPVAPPGWNYRRDGRIEDWDGTFGKAERSLQSEAAIGGKLYCTNGTRPIVIDYRTVGCQR